MDAGGDRRTRARSQTASRAPLRLTAERPAIRQEKPARRLPDRLRSSREGRTIFAGCSVLCPAWRWSEPAPDAPGRGRCRRRANRTGGTRFCTSAGVSSSGVLVHAAKQGGDKRRDLDFPMAFVGFCKFAAKYNRHHARHPGNSPPARPCRRPSSSQIEPFCPPPPPPDWKTAIAFRWRIRNGAAGCAPVRHPPHPPRRPQQHRRPEKRASCRHTRQFVAASRPTTCAYPARGGSKSSLVRPCSTNSRRGLRLIEVDKGRPGSSAGHRRPSARAAPERFIIFCDDLSFRPAESAAGR